MTRSQTLFMYLAPGGQRGKLPVMRSAAPSAIYKRVGQAISRLRQKRRPRKMSQQELATTVGVSRASIANIEQGRHRIQLHVLYDIAAALELEPHDLLPHIQGDRSGPSLPEDI